MVRRLTRHEHALRQCGRLVRYLCEAAEDRYVEGQMYMGARCIGPEDKSRGWLSALMHRLARCDGSMNQSGRSRQ